MIQLALAVGHHLLVFGLLGILVAERALAVGRLTQGNIKRLGSLDAVYGALAAAIVVVGLLRVYFGGKGPDFYFSNTFFWAKIGAFAAVALLSIAPTVRILRWRRAVARDPAFSPAPAEIIRVRRFLAAELMIFPLIPAFAAAMALGYDLD